MSPTGSICKIHGFIPKEKCKKIKRYFKNKTWYGYRCKICVAQSTKIRNRRNYKYSEKEKGKSLKRSFNITLGQYKALEESQNNLCAICKKSETALANPSLKKPKSLSVDHCHTKGKIRGLLCYNCNMMLGHAKDSIKVLQSAIEYLKLSNL